MRWTPDNSWLLRYLAEIESGNIIAGQELRAELYNLQDDLLNERYTYDTTEADRRMRFMEGCVRLTKSPFYNKPMKLMLWQKAFLEALYSFKMPDGNDRFKKALLLISRKNCKSETISALALSELIVGKPGADIVCSSNDDNQASIVYDAIDLMRQLIDPKDLDTKRNQRFILNKRNNSKVFKLSDRTRNKEGRNIDFAIIDETHEMKNNVIAKSIEQSQSLKENPKFINITTEGFVVDGYLDNELQRAREIINGEASGAASERFLPWLYTQDSEEEIWNDRSSWQKSNPTLGIVKRWEYLDEQVDLARESKADRMFVLTKDFNIKQSAAESWLNLEDYSYDAKFDLEDFRGCEAIGAVDLSETTDLTCAKIMMMKPGDTTKYVHTKYFIPESKLENSDDSNAGAKYKQWIDDGLITVSPGSDNDLAMVADWFYSLYEDYDIKLWRCGYDQRFSKEWISRMEYYGWMRNEELDMIAQNAATLSNAMKLCEQELKHHRINYNENPVDRWCLGNAGIKVDNYGQCLCVKKERDKRIDGAVTLIILYETYRRYRTEYKIRMGDER